MSLFSQRKGITQLKKTFQREAVDDELKNRLWSALKIIVWDEWSSPDMVYGFDEKSKLVNNLLDRIWLNYCSVANMR